MLECDIRDHLRFGVTPFLQGPLLPNKSLPTVPSWIRSVRHASYILLEFRLGQEDEAVDLAWACDPQRITPPPGADRKSWPAIARFSEMWLSDEQFSSNIGSLGFEADGGGLAAPPALFFVLEEHARSKYLQLARRLSEIFAVSFSPAIENTIRRSIEAAPRDAVFPYIGLMISRDRAPIRIGVRAGGPSETLLYLQTIGWSGPYEALSTFLNGMDRRFGGLVPYIAFDALDGVQPRLGLEYIFAESEPGPQSLAAAVLEYLVELGLCSPKKRDALLDWPGIAIDPRVDLSHSWVSRFIDAGNVHLFHRCLAHLKIVFEPGRSIAKAYLECSRLRIRNAMAA